MAAEVLVSAGVGDAVSKLSTAIIDVIKQTSLFRSKLTKIQDTIAANKSTFERIEKLNNELGRPKQEKEMFIAQLRHAETLVLKCLGIKCNPYKKYTHAGKLDDFNASLLRFCQIDAQLLIVSSVMELLAASDTKKEDNHTHVSSLAHEDPLEDLKAMVLKESVVVVSGGLGFGKTTLMKRLWSDPDIQEEFGRNIYLVCVTENPDLQSITENLVEMINANQRLNLNNDDDAIQQWRRSVGIKSSKILIILDDVYSDDIVDLFLTRSPGCKIVVTSRKTFPQYKTYELQLLNRKDATNLFRQRVFEGKDADIPDDLVGKLVESCKGLPLALAVVAERVRGKEKEMWDHTWQEIIELGISSFPYLKDAFVKPVLEMDDSIRACLQRSIDVPEQDSRVKLSYVDFI